MHTHTLLFITQVKTHSFTHSPYSSSICSLIHFHSHYIRLQHTVHSYALSSAPMSRVSHSLCSFIRSLSLCNTPCLLLTLCLLAVFPRHPRHHPEVRCQLQQASSRWPRSHGERVQSTCTGEHIYTRYTSDTTY